MTAVLNRTQPLPRDVRAHAPPEARDPAHELYDHAAGLLTAAQALEAAAAAPGSVAAIAPTLTCLQTSLAALAGTVERLRGHALARLTDPALGNEPLRADVSSRLGRLAGVLDQGSVVAGRSRAALAEPAEVAPGRR
jgi:hypothetical protein